MLLLLLLCLIAASFGAAAPLSLLCLGDWGGASDAAPTTRAQLADARGMAAAAGALGAEAVLLLGDNFYTHGVETNTSSRFRDTFEAVYPPSLFRQLPFYVVAGNHDHRGNVQAQIDYHGSPRWHFPALYYTLRWNFTGYTMDCKQRMTASHGTIADCRIAGPSRARPQEPFATLPVIHQAFPLHCASPMVTATGLTILTPGQCNPLLIEENN